MIPAATFICHALSMGAHATFVICKDSSLALTKGVYFAERCSETVIALQKGVISMFKSAMLFASALKGRFDVPGNGLQNKLPVKCYQTQPSYRPIGGRRSHTVPFFSMYRYLSASQYHHHFEACDFEYRTHIISPNLLESESVDKNLIYVHIPLVDLLDLILVKDCRNIAALHGISNATKATQATLRTLFSSHTCNWTCVNHISGFAVISLYNVLYAKEKTNIIPLGPSPDMNCDVPAIFPPMPLSSGITHTVVSAACRRMQQQNFEESGCAVCGQLTPLVQLLDLSQIQKNLHILSVPGITRQERFSEKEPIAEHPYVLDQTCDHVCITCHGCIIKNKIPRNSLASGLWLGAVPPILSSLQFVERMLIARVRHSCCAIKVASGMRKMKANAIAFQSPVTKVYDILPPPRSDLDEVLAIVFTGPYKPTQSDFARTPLLVRRNCVKLALQWLILNHKDYENVKFSESNLHEYPEHIPPVSIEYQEKENNKDPEGVSVFDVDEEDGTEHGSCAFTVHGLTGEQLQTMTTNAIKAKALQHLNNYGRILAVGHSENPESIWDNPQLYPQMFPWLFPYGMGGIGSISRLSDKEHKKMLLMYHDKRFQKDPNFPFVAFSHQQIKTATRNSYLLSEKRLFQNISHRLLHLDMNTIEDLLRRMSQDEFVQPTTEAESQCFKLLSDLDHISGNIKGSSTSKKWMRNEIWSLVAHLGAPFWYITLSPADIKHPICLYFAGTNERFRPEILPYDERLRLICSNPVAGARFFHFVVTTFIEVVLGYEADHEGLFGHISGYYGTVEQQGRLTLHLHILLWLLGNLSPQEMRTQILDPNSDFQQKIVKWIESCQVGEFLTGSHDEVIENVKLATACEDYTDPTETLPLPPPALCPSTCGTCEICANLDSWWRQYNATTDDLILKSNVHNCNYGRDKNGSKAWKSTFKGCRDNKYGNCKARFPRPTFNKTEIDLDTGAINIKKGEPWINSVSPAMTYLFRCNTDVTCMWSGTALKAVIVYISDYITKSGLKTHVVFDAIKSVFSKNSEILNKDVSDTEKGRQLLCKIANLLATKSELGGPMVCMYLLDQPDHYTSHTFIPFYWKSFVDEVLLDWNSTDPSIKEPQLMLYNLEKQIIGFSPIHDYIYRPTALENLSLYSWRRQCYRLRMAKNRKPGTHNSDEFQPDKDSHEDDNISSSKLPNNSFRFLKDHPFYRTHICTFSEEDDKKVINFIGSPLPRSDKGDREYYCCTMLTLFKPWRSGRQLKSEKQTWDDAFNAHIFSQREEQIMKNFNIKYECLDARDDYRAQLKKGAEHTLFGYGDSNETTLDDENPESCLCTDQPGSYDPPTEIPTYGIQELKMQREAAEIRAILTRTGWNRVTITAQDIQKLKPFVPAKIQRATQWKSAIQLQKKKILEEVSALQNMPKSNKSKFSNFLSDNVKIVSKHFLQMRFYVTTEEDSINSICSYYSLNEEQERAFKIISHHAVMGGSQQLKMYIGGMGGTGKTQVIKALSCFFMERGEPYRFISVAPTGTAAALLSGSTYHSKFAINEFRRNASEKTLSLVRSQTLRVDYIFLDEVSMLSCHDLYRISAQLARIYNCHELPFGNKNMIFAGDFAQLPPVVGGENVSLYSRTIGMFASQLKSQEEAIGKALWHQFITVVILRKNMRQTNSSEDDDKFRAVLRNMRYKDCTAEDIAFLKGRITTQEPGGPSICDPSFANVSIITAKNIQKDEINRLGCEKFAKTTGQSLTHFYSEDSAKFSSQEEPGRAKQSGKKLTTISYELQKELWDLPHSSADKHIPGKLSLCVGMPIMIKHNEATELCITNGQEATVVGWKSGRGSWNQQTLDILFVKLSNPPTPVQMDGLPLNVVPLTRNERTITCKLRNDTKVTFTRSQVEILPNFAMTDYASQGKTREFNVVDLHDCRSHQAYYTALSRSATADGTLILQKFDERKITGKASGALRQEFRELELLDEITKLQYNNMLSNKVNGTTRRPLIESYRKEMGYSYVPATIHPSLVWNAADPFKQDNNEAVDWKIVGNSKKKTTVLTGTKSTEAPNPDKNSVSKKRKLPSTSDDSKPKKKVHISPTKKINLCLTPPAPEQFTWNENSCAFDAYFSVLYALWNTDQEKWSETFQQINREFLGKLAENFKTVRNGTISINAARDDLRHLLAEKHGNHFTWGHYTSLYDLMDYTLQTPFTVGQSSLVCANAHAINTPGATITTGSCLVSSAFSNSHSIQHLMSNFGHETSHTCPFCGTAVKQVFRLMRRIPLLIIDLSNKSLHIDHRIEIDIINIKQSYSLRGILYYGGNHFTSRFISYDEIVWFHDGMTTNRKMEKEGKLDSNINLLLRQEMHACAAIYEAL